MSGMNYPGETIDSFWETIKIKDLPIKEDIDKNAVLLVEDDQDTKQMSVGAFFNAIEQIANEMLEELRGKIAEVDEFMKKMHLREMEYTQNEQDRQNNNIKFIKDEQERRLQFEEWGRTWQNIWNPYFDNCQAKENIRIANENERQNNESLRILEWNRWVVQMTQWEHDEGQRTIQEEKREAAELVRNQNVQDAITIINDTYTTAVDKCDAATKACKEVTEKLDSMFEIGSEVPTDLDENKVYFQYFE